MKALVGASNQEKALVGAFSVIVQPVVEPMDRFAALGEYELTSWRQTHGRFRQVYKHMVKDRYWNLQRTFGKVFTITEKASTRGLLRDCGIFVKTFVSNRYIFFIGHGYGWSIGTLDFVLKHKFFHTAGPRTKEPWIGTWRKGQHVTCKQREYKRYLRMYNL